MPERQPIIKAGLSVGFLAVSAVAILILLSGCSNAEQNAEDEPAVVEEIPPFVEEEAPPVSEASIIEVFKDQAGEDWEVIVDMPGEVLTVYFTIPVGLPSYEPLATNLLIALNQVNEQLGTAFDLELRGLQEVGGELILTIVDGEVVFQP